MPIIAFNKRKRRLGNAEQFKIRLWNVSSLAYKKMELQQELKYNELLYCYNPNYIETKKKLKGSTDLEDYILIYSNVAYGRGAATGEAVLIRKVLKT